MVIAAPPPGPPAVGGRGFDEAHEARRRDAREGGWAVERMMLCCVPGRDGRGWFARAPRLVGDGGTCASGVVLETVAEARSASDTPAARAATSAVWTTNAGSLRLARIGIGASYGQSVSTSMRSSGT